MVKKEKEYVTHTCKNCECAFNDIDECNVYVHPPTYKYCPECVELGFKNTKEAREVYKKVARFEEYAYKWWEKNNSLSIEDTDWVFDKAMEIAAEYQEFGKPINTRSIFNQAREILSYYKEEENENKSKLLS